MRRGDRAPIPVQPAVVPGVDTSEAGHRIVERAVPGWQYHQDKYKENPDTYNNGWEFTCSCGWFLSGQMRKDGSVDRRVRVGWEGHLDAVRNEGLIIDMGKIHRSRSEQTVQVMPSALALELGFESNSQWAEYTIRNPWVGVITTDTKNTSKQRILFGYYEREAAVTACREYLRKQSEQYKITITETAAPQITVKEETNRLLEAADRAIASGDLRDVAVAWEMFEDFERLLPIIRQKRGDLEFARNTLLTKTAQ